MSRDFRYGPIAIAPDGVRRAASPVGQLVHTSQHLNDSHSVDL